MRLMDDLLKEINIIINFIIILILTNTVILFFGTLQELTPQASAWLSCPLVCPSLNKNIYNVWQVHKKSWTPWIFLPTLY